MTISNDDPGDRTRIQKPLILTMGDPAGIGPEIALKAWMARDKLDLPAFCMIADPRAVQNIAWLHGIKDPVELVDTPLAAVDVFDRALPVVPIECDEQPVPGVPTSANANAILKSIELAVSLVMDGQAMGLVTNPISKAQLYEAGFSHPGHTEYLGQLAKDHTGETSRPVMMLAARELRVVPLTIHIPLKDVSASITKELIMDVVKITASGLQQDFSIAQPRIALTGLNPHAGENGAMGMEETDIIAPAIEALQADGYLVSGPHPGDTMFHETARHSYDAAIAMYHDQALIPIKTLAFDRGVNLTLGLPFVRTSPDHGTAFDIAGQYSASEISLAEALKQAYQMSNSRNLYLQQRSAN